jgi:putative aminopeptidase FrvX
MLNILKEVCALPTAPFVEHRVVAYVESFVRARKRLRLSRDHHGNLLIELPGKKRNLPRWVFGAHMDHPGFVTKRMLDDKTVECDFRGWVLADLMPNTRVRFFDDGHEVTGKVIDATPDKDAGRGAPAKSARVRVSSPLPANVAGMFDLGEGTVRGNRFQGRVCDDLAGAAAALAMIDDLHRAPPTATVAVLLTRAEEEGFIGAIAAVLQPKLLRKTDRMIAIETSAMQPYAPQGKGPIIRVGDRTSIFNSALTYFLTQQAEAIRKKQKSFAYQRALMPGGTCEATVYDLYGYHAASICVALGNYHNMNREKKRIAPEYIDLNDWKGMVRLFLQVARNGHDYDPGNAALRERIEKRFGKVRRLLKTPRQA